MTSRARRNKKDFAQGMRNNPTRAEELLWKRLKNQAMRFKFRRQVVILGWIADFYCRSAQLIVEADGPIHDKKKDRYRDSQIFKATGIRTVRFTNEEILLKTSAVLISIRKALRRIPQSPTVRTVFPQKRKQPKISRITGSGAYPHIHSSGGYDGLSIRKLNCEGSSFVREDIARRSAKFLSGVAYRCGCGFWHVRSPTDD